MSDKLVYLGHGIDSTVFRKGLHVLKFYEFPSRKDISRYHTLHRNASSLIKQELDSKLILPGNFAWKGKRIKEVTLRVLELTEEMIKDPQQNMDSTEIYDENGNILPKINIPAKHTCVTEVPFIGGESFYTYQNTSEGVQLLHALSAQMSEVGIPIVGANEFPHTLHPINIKLFQGSGNGIALVITDIGAHITATLAAT